MNRIEWTENAEIAYDAIIIYLAERWSYEIALKFEEQVEDLIDHLTRHKHLCPRTEKSPNLRRCVINKHNSLIYAINGDALRIIAIYNNRSNIKF